MYVFSLACGYDKVVYDRFIGTFLNNTTHHTLVLFISNNDKHKIEEHHRIILNIITINIKHVHLNLHRFVMYKEFLEKNPVNDDLFMTDFRDVLFQNDFSFPSETHDYVFAQEGEIIRNCPHNSKWMSRFIKNEYYDDMKDEYIFCSGTIFVKKNMMMNFFDILTSHFHKIKIFKFGCDQGLLNYLIYTGLFQNMTRTTNDGTVINTIKYGHMEIKDGKIINERGEIPSIVHQYDRMPTEMLKKLSNKYNFLFKGR